MKDGRAIWFAAVLVLLAGYTFVFRVDEGRIVDRIGENATMLTQLAAAEERIRNQRRFEIKRARLRDRLRSIDLERDRTRIVAAFVREAVRITAQHHTTIVAVAAGAGKSSSAPAHPPFDAVPLELTIEGRYYDLLAAIRALSASRVLAGVEVASITRKEAASRSLSLTSAVRVVIEHLSPGDLSDVPARHA